MITPSPPSNLKVYVVIRILQCPSSNLYEKEQGYCIIIYHYKSMIIFKIINHLTNCLDSEISVTSVTGDTSKRAAARGSIFFPNELEAAITWEYPPVW